MWITMRHMEDNQPPNDPGAIIFVLSLTLLLLIMVPHLIWTFIQYLIRYVF